MTILTLALVLVQAAGLPDVKTCGALVVTTPRDEWRLTVMPDGSARVNYAALPQTLEAPPRTFDFPQLHSALSMRVRTTRTTADSGTVECRTPGVQLQRQSFFFDDETFAARQFDRVWARAPAPSDPVEKEHVDLLREMWHRRERPR